MTNPSIPFSLDLPNLPLLPQSQNPELWNELLRIYKAIKNVAASGGSGGGFTNPMTALGDLITGGASGVPGRLALGAIGTVLSSNGSTAAWLPVDYGPFYARLVYYTTCPQTL